MTDTTEKYLAKTDEYQKKKKFLKLKQDLPHLYGWPFYKWARKFWESRKQHNFLCSANQIGKSTYNIRKCIHWATATDLWPKLWSTIPRQFWYLYPTKAVATVEFESKWVPDILPSGQYKNSKKYGWKEFYGEKKMIAGIRFKSGVTVYFKTYKQEVQALQTATVHAVFCDEELPEELFDEINFRIQAVDGFYHQVFTATLGQELWRVTMQPEESDVEKFPAAFKQQISMYDCMEYEDGEKSHWTKEKIKRVAASCKSEAEVQRRVYGKFVTSDDLRIPKFDRGKNTAIWHPVPTDWKWFVGVDVGSGNVRAHPAAVVFVATSPGFDKGRVIMSWRGDNELTTAGDIMDKFKIMRGDITMMGQYYDFESRDFKTIADRIGEPFMPAEKKHETGEQMLNTLFQYGMLKIYVGDEKSVQNYKLVTEISNLRSTKAKNINVKDDLYDALRYAITKIPWDWTAINSTKEIVVVKKEKTVDELRREFVLEEEQAMLESEMEAEFEEWNERYYL